MKRLILLMCMAFSLHAMAQTKPVKIVFDVASGDTLVHQAALRHVSAMATAYPQSTFEVVIYGGALPMVMKNKSSVAKGIQKLEGNSNVSFKVCQETMK